METSRNSWITTVLFEHACKQDFNGVVNHISEDKNLVSKIVENSVTSESKQSDQRIKPVFMLVYLLKKLCFGNFTTTWSGKKPSLVIELLESTFKQRNCISLKKFLTLISELKLLDLLNLIVTDSESSHVVHKLNQYFPRWSHDYQSSVKRDFSITNPKILEKVEESHTQCRRLILKLAVDKVFKSKYMSEQYSNDINKLTKESKIYIKEIISALESQAGPSVLEKIADGEKGQNSDDLAVQLLLDYIQPVITDEVLLRYLDDLETTLNSQPTSCFTTCLLPFDTISEMSDEESDQSVSDYEDVQDIDSLRSFRDILPSDSPTKSKEVLMDVDDI